MKSYIDHINGFWILHDRHQFSMSEIAMFFHLTDVWNKTIWIGTFKRNNSKVMADLSIKSFKTLQSIRDRLRSVGILQYKQRNGVTNCEYTMEDLGKICRGFGKGSVEGSGKGSVEGLGVVNKTETKTKTFTRGSTRAGEKNDFFTEEPPGPKQEVPCAENFLFKDCMKIYDGFVRKRSPMGPMIDADEEDALRNMLAYLQDEVGASLDEETTAERVKERWRSILERWHLLDNFHLRRIRLRDINDDWTNILTQIQNATNSQTTKGTGANSGSGTGDTRKTGSSIPTPGRRGSDIDALQSLKYDGDNGAEERTELADFEIIN